MRRLFELLESRRLLSSTWYVDANSTGVVHDGTTWGSAYLEIQQALASALVGDEVRVADGVYAASAASPVQLKSGVKLLGGFAGSGSIVPNSRDIAGHPSTIEGSGTTANSGLVLGTGTDSTALLDGFIVQSGPFNGRSIYIDAGSPTISNCTFRGGMGLYNVDSSPTISNCLFDSVEGDDGGGMTNTNSSPTVIDSQFINCRGVTGGAMRNNFGSSPIITGCTFTGNQATHEGQAIYSYASSLTMSNCTFQDNGQASEKGGAIYSTASSSLVISNTSFTGNTSGSADGGAIHASGTLVLTGCSFNSNHGGYSGGAIYSTASLTLTNCNFSGNSASNGGAVYLAGGSFSATNNSFTANSATFGGAIYAGSSSGSPILTKCSFTDNTAQYGGGMYNYGNSPRLNGCSFVRNKANLVANSSAGGGLYSNSATILVTGCGFFGNFAADDGGGAYNYGGTISTYVNSVFVGNVVTGVQAYGGALLLASNGSIVESTYNVINCTFSSNIANRGGAIGRNSEAGPMNLINSVLWGNRASTGDQIYGGPNPGTVSHNLIEGGLGTTDSIDSDPLFLKNPSKGADNVWGTADDDYGDLRVKLDSPCLDAGSNAWVPVGITTDFASDPRIVDVPGVNDPGNLVDIGAYEYQAPLAVTSGAFLYNAPHPTITLTFNGDVDSATLAVGDLTLRDPVTNLPAAGLPPVSLVYDAGTRTAQWIYSSTLPDGNYRARIAAGSVADTHGYALSVDYSFDFFVLAGDANRDRKVDIGDLVILATNWGGTGKTFSQGDFNYDHVVNSTDLAILATHWQHRVDPPPLPSAPVPTAAATRAVRTPTRIASAVLL